MTTHAVEPTVSHETLGVTIRSSSWAAYAGCVVANVLLVALLWSLHLAILPNSMIGIFFVVAVTAAVFYCYALAALFTFAGLPMSIGRVLLGIGSMAATSIVLSVSPICRQSGPISWDVVLLMTTSPILASILLRLFGLRVRSARRSQVSSSQPWQFSMRSLFVGTTIAAFYALLTSSIFEQGVVVRVLQRTTFHQIRMESFTIYANLVLCHVAVALMALVLWRVRTLLTITLLGSVLMLPIVFREFVPLSVVALAAMPGICLLCLIATILPWSLAGIHATWEKPVFER